jgi:CobQ-like glutamine amidotransferase family enzyme
MVLRLCHLYPAEMNIYADRGNIAVLERRLAWRGMALTVAEAGLDERIDPEAHDLFYLGGGQDRDQAVVAEDLAALKGESLREAAAAGAVVLAVCGGFQLAGHGYTALDGSRMPGIGLLDADTVAGATRLIGNLAIEADLDGERSVLVGFENHAGRTTLGPAARPLGRVLHGHGNNGLDAGEGAVQGRVIGSYLHGPLLPKNPWLADRLIAWGLDHATGEPVDLAPLDDDLEAAARETAIRRARGSRLHRRLWPART